MPNFGEEESSEFFWLPSARPKSEVRAVPGEMVLAAQAVIRELLLPRALRVTAEPLRRLCDRAVLGYQLRWRLPRIDALPSPDDFWRAAAEADLLEPLDDALLHAQLEVAKNVRPSAVLITLVGFRRRRPGVAGLLAREVRRADIPASRVVWQLNGGEEITDSPPLADLAFDLRFKGFKVALVGIGESRTRMSAVAAVVPEILHIDATLVSGVASDAGSAAAVGALVEFARRVNSRVAAGGIATRQELDCLQQLGVEYGMGPLFGLPQVAEGPEAVELIRPRLILDMDVAESGVPSQGMGADPELRTMQPLTTVMGHAPQDVTAELGHAARSLQAEHDPGVILELAADHLARMVPYDGLTIYQADWDALRFRPLLARSEAERSYVEGVMGHTFAIGTGVTGWAFDLGTPQIVNDADAHPAAGHLPGTSVDDESMLLIPLVAGDHRLGIMNLVRFRTDAFAISDLTTATLMGHMTAAAWRNAQLYAEQLQHAITDPLTGLLNTRWLRDSARRELALAERQQRDLMLLMVDLDQFKLVNDSCGHGAGDAVLRAVGRALQEAVRAEDAAIRYGGEEFVVLLHDAGPEGATRVWRELQRRLAEIPLPPECPLKRVTASAGLARYPDHGRTISQLLGAADAAMYSVKRLGGNEVASA
ncbi:MAG TPA: diguanylate cyclase [Candidatus Dormibacteraeota bacterium]|nr:diguanylate cyclase [Candidatus Dormibacteraeota bacterium]